MRFQLLHHASFELNSIAIPLESEQIDAREIGSSGELRVDSRPTVFILDPPSRPIFSPEILRSFVDAGGAIVVLGNEGEEDIPEELQESASAYVPYPPRPRQMLVAIRAAYRTAVARSDTTRARQEAASRTKEIKELTQIGVALATERDYNALLGLILSQARRLTGSDAGSLYLVEELENEEQRLRFKLSQNHSRPDIPFVEFTIPIDHSSIAGYVASTGEPLVIDDAYFLPHDVEYTINRSFDEKYGYRTKSMMTIPMKDHKDAVIGVLQLINRKTDFDAVLVEASDFDKYITPFSPRTVELVSSLAGQAAVSIENSQLYESIERLFEGFVEAAVTAIESRDPTTFGHSGRVASMTTALGEAVDRLGAGKYAATKFTREEMKEIRYAGLLHDFGKVGVREQVLVKAKKLYPTDMSLIRQRYAFIKRTAERDLYRQRAEFLEQHGRDGYSDFLDQVQAAYDQRVSELDHFMELVNQSNEPTVLPEGSFEELVKYGELTYKDLEGSEQPYLTDDEVRYLSIRKGSLDDTERLEIESHVAHTYRFLLQIPWTKELQNIPNIAYGHHEKLNGAGYPRRVKAPEIPVQTRMMTISDIFDALTASDRPYKRAVPHEKALDIMRYEVEGQMLDPELFQIFIESRAFDAQDS